MVRLTPLYETRKLYTELLTKYKTVSSKKAFLTRELAAMLVWVNDVEEAVNRVNVHGQPCTSRGWLHGEHYGKWHLHHYKNELSILRNMRAELDSVVVA